MAERDAPAPPTIPHPDLAAEDARRAQVEKNRARLHERLEAEFGAFRPNSQEANATALVRGFLSFVADNVHAYATRCRVQHPETGDVVEAEWVTLCGATIAALDVPDRIRTLVLELVDELLPTQDRPRREALWQAAGVPFRARASASDVTALQKQGMLASFAGKLLVDSKRLVATADAGTVRAYFETARRIALDLQASPYQTDRDRKFLGLVRKQYKGGLAALVDAQHAATLAELHERDQAAPGLERVLRSLLERPYEQAQSRSLEDWVISSRILYQTEAYVYARLDEFREALQRRIAYLEAQPMPNPEAALEAATGSVSDAVAHLEKCLARAGATAMPRAGGRLDLMQVVRENASLLARPELAGELDACLSDDAVLEAFARYKVASFRCAQPSIRKRLEHDLVLWDELLRSAPLSPAQQARLDALREDLLAPLRKRGAPLPEHLPEPRMLLPFGRQVLPLLAGEEDYAALERFLRRVRQVYTDPHLAAPAIAPAASGIAVSMGAESTDPQKSAQTQAWVPTLLDVPTASTVQSTADHTTGRRSSTAKTWIRAWDAPDASGGKPPSDR